MPDPGLANSIRDRLETGGDRIADLHLWRVGPGHAAAIVALVSDRPLPPAQYKARLGGLPGLSHVTVEVNRCEHAVGVIYPHAASAARKKLPPRMPSTSASL